MSLSVDSCSWCLVVIPRSSENPSRSLPSSPFRRRCGWHSTLVLLARRWCESPRSRIVNSSLSGTSSRAKPATALSWPGLRFLHHSLICSPLESLVPISTSFSVPFIFSTQALSRLRQLLLDRFFKILAVLDVGVCACTLFSAAVVSISRQ